MCSRHEEEQQQNCPDQERCKHIRIGKVLHAHRKRGGDVALSRFQTHHATNVLVASTKDKPNRKRGDDEKQQDENATGADQTRPSAT